MHFGKEGNEHDPVLSVTPSHDVPAIAGWLAAEAGADPGEAKNVATALLEAVHAHEGRLVRARIPTRSAASGSRGVVQGSEDVSHTLGETSSFREPRFCPCAAHPGHGERSRSQVLLNF